MKRLRLLFLTLLLCLALRPSATSAHVLVPDTTRTKAAILHLQPDDDPIAGEPAQLFFDVQGGLLADATVDVQLLIRAQTGGEEKAGVYIDGTQLRAIYVFPRQGLYTLMLTVQAADGTHEFMHLQHVTRGVAGGALDQPDHAWAQLLLVSTCVALVVLSIVFLNRRQAIAARSKF